MFGFISKKELKKYMDGVKATGSLKRKYTPPITEDQKIKNVYAQGYEDGTDNFYNAVCSKFNIKRKFGA